MYKSAYALPGEIFAQLVTAAIAAYLHAERTGDAAQIQDAYVDVVTKLTSCRRADVRFILAESKHADALIASAKAGTLTSDFGLPQP